MNIAKILKNVPVGTKLYSPLCGECTLAKNELSEYILVKRINGALLCLTPDGKYMDDGECMIFPSKDNRDWNNFNLFKKGDILITELNSTFIFNGKINDKGLCGSYCGIDTADLFWKTSERWTCINSVRIATEEEKRKLFIRLKKEGYEWDSCNMTLINITKFNILELKPFDKVLVRDNNYNDWKPALFYKYEENLIHPYVVSIYSSYAQCIPYNDDTKHLVGTNKDCPKYYKTW